MGVQFLYHLWYGKVCEERAPTARYKYKMFTYLIKAHLTTFAIRNLEGGAGKMSGAARVAMVEPTLEKIITVRNTSREMLDVPCPEKVCREIALKLTSWKLLAPFLKLDGADEADIDADYKKNAEKKIGKFNFR